MAHTTSGRVGPWPNGGVHVGPQHPLQPHARQEVSLGGRAVSCEAAKLVGPFTRPHFLSLGTSLETENLGLRAVVDFGPQEAVPLLGTCMHVSVRTHTDTHTRTLSLSLSLTQQGRTMVAIGAQALSFSTCS